MKYLVVSQYGEGLYLADILRRKNHDVRITVTTGSTARLRNIVGITTTHQEVVEWGPDKVLFTYPAIDLAETMRIIGIQIPTIGGHAARVMIEYPSEFGRINLEKSKIAVADTNTKGIKVTCGAWFDKDHWLSPTYYEFAERTFLPDGYGAKTGYEGAVSFSSSNTKEKLFSRTIKRLTGLLRASNYIGPVIADFIVDDEGMAYVSSISCDIPAYFRMGATAQELEGKDSESDEQFTITLRVSIPPYPLPYIPSVDPKADLELRNLILSKAKFTLVGELDIYDDVFNDFDGPRCAGYTGSLGYLVETSDDSSKVYESIRSRVSALGSPFNPIQARVDIGRDIVVQLKKLRKFGFLVPARKSAPKELAPV